MSLAQTVLEMLCRQVELFCASTSTYTTGACAYPGLIPDCCLLSPSSSETCINCSRSDPQNNPRQDFPAFRSFHLASTSFIRGMYTSKLVKQPRSHFVFKGRAFVPVSLLLQCLLSTFPPPAPLKTFWSNDFLSSWSQLTAHCMRTFWTDAQTRSHRCYVAPSPPVVQQA